VKYYNTLIASIFFSANLQVLMNEKGYFDPDIHGNPLLHLWSLGVEEQFYIFWPFLLSFVVKSYKSKIFKIIVSYTAISFVLSIVAVYQSPKFAFYFPFCRFWQMSIGGILAYLNFKISDMRINNGISFVGLIALLITVWTMDD
jgi:peptidoglycan/LPS O-acetylase OafA/YrhL